jgi:hypothetical protein
MQLYRLLSIWLFMASAILLTSCEDVIELDLDEGTPAVVIDGWVLLDMEKPNQVPDTIKLKRTIPYFDNRPLPPITNALVIISASDGQIDTLTEISAGHYITNSLTKAIGLRYTLDVFYEGEHYQGISTLNRVPPIDSLKLVFTPRNGLIEEGYYLYYFGPEPEGRGDCYRFKIFRNGRLLNSIQDLIVTDDGFLLDGVYIDSLPVAGNGPPKYFFEGDTIRCEVHSINRNALEYYLDVINQIQNGGLFATPLANVRFTVYNVNRQSPKRGVGIFGASAFSSKTVVAGGQ